MKKSILVLLTFFYLITASGLNASLHYCGGKYKSVSFLKHGDEDACCGKKMKKHGCCKDKAIVVKIKDNHKYSSDLKLPESKNIQLFSVALPQSTLNFSNIYFSEIISFNHAPPNTYKTPLYLQHRVLII
jgi:hypothetical protein